MILRSFLVAAVLAVTAPAIANAADVKVGDLTVSHAWARATADTAANGAAYVTITNGGSTSDRLVTVASPVAANVQLHTHLIEDGIMKMRPVAGIDIEPGAPIELRPGGLHIMLMGLKAPLKEADDFPVDLTFQKSGKVTAMVHVEAAGAGMANMHHEH